MVAKQRTWPRRKPTAAELRKLYVNMKPCTRCGSYNLEVTNVYTDSRRWRCIDCDERMLREIATE